MMTRKTNLLTTAKLATAALLFLGGCHDVQSQMERDKAGDAFSPEGDTRDYRRAMIAQEAAGARKDGMWYAYHFDGDRLNSLGQSKLSLMMRANDQAFPIVVYMNVPNDPHLQARQDAVQTYMTDAGLRREQLAFETGPNPNVTSSAAQNLQRYGKTEDVSTTGSNPGSPQAPGYGTGGGPGNPPGQ
jgi:hypothetical protein